MPFLFLDDVKTRFVGAYGERAATAIAFAMNAEFSRTLTERMEYYNSDPAADNFGKVKGQIEDVKGAWPSCRPPLEPRPHPSSPSQA
jgi:hypothetical protein